MRRLLLLVALAGLLGGCNMVTSTRPLFGKADTDGAAQLRPGLWVLPNPNCAFDPATPAHTWPECAGSLVVRPGYFRELRMGSAAQRAGEGKAVPQDAIPYVIVGVYPSVLQMRIGDPGKPKLYVFVGLRPVKFDDVGRIIEAQFWHVQCGPPAPPPANAKAQTYRQTKSPLPGLTLKDSGCIAHDPASVIRAARASEGWTQIYGGPSTIRWVRDPPK